MKKSITISLLVWFMLTCIFNVNVHAVSSEKDSVKSKLSVGKIAKEKEIKIKKAMDEFISKKRSSKSSKALNASGKDSEIDKYDLGELSETYILPDLFLGKYNKNDGLIKLITKESRVNVKVTDNSGKKGFSSFVFDENNEAQLLGTAFDIKDDSIIPDYDTLASTISDNISNVNDIKFAHSFRYYTTFVLIEAQDNEYLIPYSTAPKMTGLSNGKVYTAKKAVDVMLSKFDEKAATEQGNLNGGTPTKVPHNYVPVFATITIIFALLTINSVIKTRKNKRIQ